MAQLAMIIKVFVSQSQSIDPLTQKIFNRMRTTGLAPRINKTASYTRQKPDSLICRSQQQASTIGSDGLTTENGLNFAAFYPFESDRIGCTICHGGSVVRFVCKRLKSN